MATTVLPGDLRSGAQLTLGHGHRVPACAVLCFAQQFVGAQAGRAAAGFASVYSLPFICLVRSVSERFTLHSAMRGRPGDFSGMR